MSVKVIIIDGPRQVTVETTANTPVPNVVTEALRVWTRSKARRDAQERPVLQAGGMGFQAELADPEVR